MIPYIAWKTIEFGPITLQVWGLFVALGFLLGTYMAGWLAKRRGQDAKVIYDIVPWLAIVGMLGARLGHVLLYEPGYYAQHPLEALAIWQGGMSIFGGLIACLIFTLWYLRRRQVDVFIYADILAFGLPFGKWIGRLGCFFIHDHPGTATDFVLGVQYPDGVVRHDHGLYLSLNAFILSSLFLWLSRKPRPTGTYLAVFGIWYGMARFFLDFYRVNDVTYLGLTPAQYLCILMVAGGLGLAVWIKQQRKIA